MRCKVLGDGYRKQPVSANFTDMYTFPRSVVEKINASDAKGAKNASV
jgi:hypothetical protein